jgi:hypothetical protein
MKSFLPPKQSRLAGIPRGRQPRVKETEIAKECRNELARRGYLVLRIQCGLWRPLHGKGLYTGAPKGTPDYVALHPRRPGFLLETKTQGRWLSPEQSFQHQVIQQGFQLAICTVRDVWALMAWLDEFEGLTASDPERKN